LSPGGCADSWLVQVVREAERRYGPPTGEAMNHRSEVEGGGVENRFGHPRKSNNLNHILLSVNDLHRIRFHLTSFHFTGFDGAIVTL